MPPASRLPDEMAAFLKWFEQAHSIDPLLKAGLAQVPFALTIILIGPRSPKLVARFGANVVVDCGCVCDHQRRRPPDQPQVWLRQLKAHPNNLHLQVLYHK